MSNHTVYSGLACTALAVCLALAFGCKSDDSKRAAAASAPASDVARSLQAAAADPATAENRTPCEQAFDDVRSRLAQLRAPGGAERMKLPPRDAFLAVCNKMPTEVQQCMVADYSTRNSTECRSVMTEVEPALRDEMEALLPNSMPD